MPHILSLVAPHGSGALTGPLLGRVATRHGQPRILAPGDAAEFTCDTPPDPNLVEDAAAGAPVDVVITPAANRRKRLLIADMDSTIVTGETLDELAAFAGVGGQVGAITRRSMNGEIDFAEALRERVTLLRGLPLDALERTWAGVRLTTGAQTLVRTMRAHGAYTALVSGGFTWFTGRVAALCGFDNPAHRAHVAGVWGVDPDSLPGPGRSAYELLDSLGQPGGVRALLVMASNLAVSAPRALHVQERLRALDFLCVSDIFLSETAQMADVVLPIAQWAEEDGTMTNLEGRVIRRRQAQPAPEGVWTDAKIVTALAARLGTGQFFPTAEPAVIFDELRRASAGGVADYSGISYDRIDAEHGVFWPCPANAHPGTPRLFLEKFAHDDGRAKFHAVHHRSAAEEPDDEYPLYLTTGRVMAQYQSGTQTRRVDALNKLAPEAFAEIHPALARRFGIDDGDPITLTTRRGAICVKARLTPAIRQDTLFVPFHWGGESCANALTNPALDPTSKMPEFKVCAVRVEKIP